MSDDITIQRAVVDYVLNALEELFYCNSTEEAEVQYYKATVALRAALEQPQVEQEPVAWCHLHYYKDGSYFADCLQHYQDNYCKTPLYPHPQPPRQPLTHEWIRMIYDECDAETGDEFVFTFARDIERAHGITGEQA